VVRQGPEEKGRRSSPAQPEPGRKVKSLSQAGHVFDGPTPVVSLDHAGLAFGRDAPGAEIAELAALVARPPLVGRADLLGCRGSLKRGCDYAVAIPVRNEARRLPAALAALAAAMRAVPRSGCAVFVLNDTEDRSADIIEGWARREHVSALIVEIAFAEPIRNAAHARRLALDLAAKAAPEGLIFTSDADTTVGEAWIYRCFQSIAAGYDLVCEDVLLDEDELSALPARVRQVGEAERAYLELCDLLWRYWTFGRAGGLAIRPSGASLAIRASAYLAVGGLPVPSAGEDRALYEVMAGSGSAVEALANIGTRTSARLTSRAAGGCGDALADRAGSDDPFCDSRLKPVWLLHDEAMLWLEVHQRHNRGFFAVPRTCERMRFSAVEREMAIARKLAAASGLIDAA